MAKIKKKSKKRIPAPLPAGVVKAKNLAKKQPREKRDFKTKSAHLFVKRTRSYGIGGHIPPRRDLTRLVKWPRYIRIQRQRKILHNRAKVPPAIAQFQNTLDKNQAQEIFKLMRKYMPETRSQKKVRLFNKARLEAEKKEDVVVSQKPRFLKHGLKHVTHLVEQKKVKLVVIAHDVNPIEIVVWLPALCRKMDVPYCIIKGKARLGAFVHQRTATCVAFDLLNKNDEHKLAQIIESVRPQFNDNIDVPKAWGGGIMGAKTRARVEKLERAKIKEKKSKIQTGQQL